MTDGPTRIENSPGARASVAAVRLSRLYLDALRAGDVLTAYRVSSRALEGGMSVPQLYQRVISPAMHEIGELWERGALTVADEHLATAVTNRALAALRPSLGAEAADAPVRGRAMLATVEGERHALGLRMAADILEDAGFHTIYLGADVPTDALLQAVGVLSPDLLAVSATMPELAPRLEEVASTARRSHPRLEVLIGGQAASLRLGGGTLVENLEVLPERVLPRC